MKFQADHADSTMVLRFTGDSVTIGSPAQAPQTFQQSLLVSARTGQSAPWPVQRFEDLNASHFETLLALQPQLIIFGSGQRLRFAPPALLQGLMRARIGLETMDNHAACRTYNVLSAEGRDVVLALLMET